MMRFNFNRSIIFVMIGAPGSGKSTIGKMIAEHYGIPYISSGDIAREIGETNAYAQKELDEGRKCPEGLMLESIVPKIQKADENHNSIVLDGFPRHTDQYFILCGIVKAMQIVFVHITCSETKCIQRMIKRCRDNNCYIQDRLNWYKQNTYPVLLRAKRYNHMDIHIDNNVFISKDELTQYFGMIGGE